MSHDFELQQNMPQGFEPCEGHLGDQEDHDTLRSVDICVRQLEHRLVIGVLLEVALGSSGLHSLNANH